MEPTLSDAIDVTGPIKPLSGKIVLIRYEADGTVVKKNISYSSRAKRGSKKNPFVKHGDLISFKNSILGITTGVIRDFTEPFVGIYSTKELFESFNDWWGSVHVLTNLAMPNMVKIVKTTRDLELRIADLYSTRVPLPF